MMVVSIKGVSSSDSAVGARLTKKAGKLSQRETKTEKVERNGKQKSNYEKKWGKMKREPYSHSERVQTQWNTPEPEPKAEHQKAAVKHPAINTP